MMNSKSLKNGTLNKEILKNKDVNKLLINKGLEQQKILIMLEKKATSKFRKGKKKAKLEKLFSSWDGSKMWH